MNWQRLIWIALAVVLAVTQVVLIAAKLTGRIQWSWWWTLTPLWSPVALATAAVVLAIVLLADASSNGGNPFR
jgi:hypothetical protein